MAPRQFQQRLRRSPRNFRQNFRTEVAQQLVANYLLNFPNAFHIYNKRGKRRLFTPYYWERIVTLGGKLLEMNLEDLPIGLTTEYGQPKKYNLSKGRRYPQAAQSYMPILCVITAH